jgi:DNA polymerase alpha subunit B
MQPHVIETLNPHIPQSKVVGEDSLMNVDEEVKPNAASLTSRVALAIGTDPRTWNYRYMFERPGIKGQALDDELEEMTKAILETYKLVRDDIADPSVTSQENVYVVGRIAPVLNREDRTPKLSEGMVIESSRSIGSGSRTPLQFAKSVTMRGLSSPHGEERIMHTSGFGRQIGLFPGMTAGFKGRNGGGDAFVVEEILMPTALPSAITNADELLNYQYSPSRLHGNALQIQVASGPFTNDGDLDFIPWHRLMDQVERQKPDVILLLGPFLSVHHPLLLDPNLNELPKAHFSTLEPTLRNDEANDCYPSTEHQRHRQSACCLAPADV